MADDERDHSWRYFWHHAFSTLGCILIPLLVILLLSAIAGIGKWLSGR